MRSAAQQQKIVGGVCSKRDSKSRSLEMDVGRRERRLISEVAEKVLKVIGMKSK